MTDAKRLSRGGSTLLVRFTELNAAEQLETFAAIREYLSSRNTNLKPDRQLEAQLASVRAMRRVAEHLGLDDPTKLHVEAFNSAPAELRDGWTVAKIIKAHGTWRAAREVVAGEHAVPTARQQSVRRGRAARKLRSDDYIAGVRQWLETKPPRLGTLDYDEWAREWNATRPEGSLRVVGYGALRMALGLRWDAVLATARGEMSLAEALKEPTSRRADGGSGLFVSSTDIAALTGEGVERTRRLTHREDFPICVLLYDDRRYWMRLDVIAYLAGEEVPQRKLHELNGRYVAKKEAAQILGVNRGSVNKLKGQPAPIYKGGRVIWLKSDIEEWRDQRRRDGVGSGRWKRTKTRP